MIRTRYLLERSYQRVPEMKVQKRQSNLFRRYKNINQLANANVEEIKILIRSTGFYNIKAKRIKEVSVIIVKISMP